MRRFNERKVEILGLMDRMGEATASEVAGELDINPVNASRLLGHYSHQGLLKRRTIDTFGTKSYQITRRGLKRLEWIVEGLR